MYGIIDHSSRPLCVGLLVSPADLYVYGVVLAKLDSSAKGGVGLAIKKKLDLPVYYVGVGEGIDDLVLFNPQAYVDGLLAPSSSQR